MAQGDEAVALAAALSTLGVDDRRELEVLAVQKGRRQVVRAGHVVIKAFASAEEAAFRRERTALTALAATDLGPGLVAHGTRWVATHDVPGTEVPMRLDAEEEAIHRALGAWLAALHDVPPGPLAPWSVVDRLRHRLAAPPDGCPAPLVAAVGRLVQPRLELVVDDTFVHGDWGTANVLAPCEDPTRIVRIIDFEDAHRGDAAEDFAWQVLAGPVGPQFTAMAATYDRPLGSCAEERLVVAGAEKCLDVLGWTLSGGHGTRFHDRCRATLDELVSGGGPAWPAD